MASKDEVSRPCKPKMNNWIMPETEGSEDVQLDCEDLYDTGDHLKPSEMNKASTETAGKPEKEPEKQATVDVSKEHDVKAQDERVHLPGATWSNQEPKCSTTNKKVGTGVYNLFFIGKPRNTVGSLGTSEIKTKAQDKMAMLDKVDETHNHITEWWQTYQACKQKKKQALRIKEEDRYDRWVAKEEADRLRWQQTFGYTTSDFTPAQEIILQSSPYAPKKRMTVWQKRWLRLATPQV